MTRVNLMDGYFVDIDQLNYTLKQEREGRSKDGEPKVSERIIGYFSNMSQCVERVCREHEATLSAEASISLQEYVCAVERSNRAVVDWIKEHGLNKVE